MVCNYRMVLGGVRNFAHVFRGENVIEFTPEETGTVNYTCWMGMIRGKIFVTDEEEKESLAEDPAKKLKSVKMSSKIRKQVILEWLLWRLLGYKQ